MELIKLKGTKPSKRANLSAEKTAKYGSRKEGDGARSIDMTETEQTRSGGYSGPSDFDELVLVPIDRTQNGKLLISRAAFLNHLDELKASYPDKWVAFSGETFLGAADTESELLGRVNPAGEMKLLREIYIDYVFSA